jgi:hypothetical protein
VCSRQKKKGAHQDKIILLSYTTSQSIGPNIFKNECQDLNIVTKAIPIAAVADPDHHFPMDGE